MFGRIRQGATRTWRASIAALLLLAMAGLTACGSTTGTTSGISPGVSTSSPTASVPQRPSPIPASWRRIPGAPINNANYGNQIAGIWDGNEMVAAAYVPAPAPYYCKEIAAAFDPEKGSWRTFPPLRGVSGCYDPLSRDMPVWTGKELLLWGETNVAFNPATERWRHLPDPPTGWGGPSFAVWTGRQMIGWGGGGGDLVLGDGAAYTPATNSWKMLPPAPLSPRDTTGIWTGKQLIIAGGVAPTNRGVRYFADAAAYTPRTNAWRRLAPMPLARSATAVWDGKEVLLVGGRAAARSDTQLVRRGVAYDPSTNRWRWMAPMRYPREGNVATWTGDHLIVWGGVDLGWSVPPHGEMYDPASDSWSSLPKAPLRGRWGADAVWTGAEVIVWGGWDARTNDWLPDGAVLVPSSG